MTGLGQTVDGVTNTAKGAFSKVMSYLPLITLTTSALVATALLTGGGSTALQALATTAAANPATAAAASSNFTFTNVASGLLKEGLTEGAGHIQNFAGMVSRLG